MTVTWTLLSLLLPSVLGWLLVPRIFPAVSGGLRFGLGLAAGSALAGTLYFFLLLLSDSVRFTIFMSEGLLGAAVVFLLWTRNASAATSTSEKPDDTEGRLFPWIFAITTIISGTAFFFALDLFREGGWDALVMWNMRARLIATSKASALSAIFDPAFLGFHPDYPLLLPSLVARGWQFAATDTFATPIVIAVFFTIATIFITVSGLQVVSTKSQSYVAGAILLSTPFLLGHGASQYADILVCCFVTASIVAFCIYDFNPTHARLPVLAGMTSAAAACAKNEGILFLVLLAAVRLAAGVRRQTADRTRYELLRFAGGASLGLVTLAIFKLWYSQPNDTFAPISEWPARLTNGDLHLEVLAGFVQTLNFGQWLLNPMPIMAVHLAMAWKTSAFSHSRKIDPCFTAVFVVAGMLCGHYIIYLLNPEDAESHVRASFDRLVLQLWPSAVIVYSLIVAPRNAGAVSSASSNRAKTLRVAGVLIATLCITAWFLNTRRQDMPVASTPSPSGAHIELSRTEVTAGETYAMTITGLARTANPQVYVSYSLDDKPMGQFSAYLGSDGRFEFQVSSGTRKGTYRFLAVRNADNPNWIRFDNDVAITVK